MSKDDQEGGTQTIPVVTGAQIDAEGRARRSLEAVLYNLDIQHACDAYQDERAQAVRELILDNVAPILAAKEEENEHLKKRIADLEALLGVNVGMV